MGSNSTSNSDESGPTFHMTPHAIEAVARSLYGEAEYDALPDGNQVKDAYRKRAKSLLTLAASTEVRASKDSTDRCE